MKPPVRECRLLERISMKWHTVSFTFSMRMTNLSMSRKTSATVMRKPSAVVSLRIGMSVSMGQVDRAGGVERRALVDLAVGKHSRLDQTKKADQDGENTFQSTGASPNPQRHSKPSEQA
jgi:hypothetical protein